MISAAVITVEGLKDEQSIKKITEALMGLPGVLKATVTLDQKLVTIDFDTTQVDLQSLSLSIRAAGFLPM
jgi:copper chaperone CopZ